MPEGPIVKEPALGADRVRPLPLLAVALGSFVAGFVVVHALGQSGAEPAVGRPHTQRTAPAKSGGGAKAPVPATPEAVATPAPASPPAAGTTPTPASPPAAAPASADGGTTAAAPRPAAGGRGSTVGEAFYFRCWRAGQDEPEAEATCDRLPELERRIAVQLNEIEACASGTQGLLSLGVEVQLRAKQATYWAGRRSTIAPVEPLIRCVRTRLADTDLAGIEGQFRKYTLFVPIELR